jgi:hypothetical protein
MLNYVNGNKFITLFFDPDINRFVDGMGNVIHDIYRLITPKQFYLFRLHKDMRSVKDVTNSYMVTVIYLEESKDLKY